jgi:peptidoglycan/LPS O-acetylase OafA/YrhL
LALFPDSQDPILGVAWTLRHEILFYLAFAAAICSVQAGIVVALVGAVLVAYGLSETEPGAYLGFFESQLHLDFAIGILTAHLVRRYPSSWAPAIALIGAVAFAAAAMIWGSRSGGPTVLSGTVAYGLASALIIYGLTVWENSGLLRVPRWAAYLGAASYSIYLIHTVVLGLFGKLFASALRGGSFPDAFFLIATVVAVATGCALYQFVERPLQGLIRSSRFTWRQQKFVQ